METILPNALIQKYKQLSGRCRAVFFSAPTGFGKTVAARALATGKRVITLSAREPALVLPSPDGTWGTLILDDLQDLDNDDTQKALCARLRDCPDRQFLLLSRGELPSWLMPFQVAGVLGLLTPRDLMLDREAAARLLQSHGVSLAQADLSAVCQEAKGYPLALELLAQRLERGEPCNRTTTAGAGGTLQPHHPGQYPSGPVPVLRGSGPAEAGACFPQSAYAGGSL